MVLLDHTVEATVEAAERLRRQCALLPLGMDFTPALPTLLATALGGGIALLSASIQVKRSAALQVRRSVEEQCYASFVKFHTIISSVTGENLPAMEGWHDAYIEKLKALEPVVDDLVALTQLAVSEKLANKVSALRIEFRRWRAHHIVANSPTMPTDQQLEAFGKLLKDHPQKIQTMLNALARAYHDALHR